MDNYYKKENLGVIVGPGKEQSRTYGPWWRPSADYPWSYWSPPLPPLGSPARNLPPPFSFFLNHNTTPPRCRLQRCAKINGNDVSTPLSLLACLDSGPGHYIPGKALAAGPCQYLICQEQSLSTKLRAIPSHHWICPNHNKQNIVNNNREN